MLLCIGDIYTVLKGYMQINETSGKEITGFGYWYSNNFTCFFSRSHITEKPWNKIYVKGFFF